MTPSQHLYTAAALITAGSLALIVGAFIPAVACIVAGVAVAVWGVRK